MPLASTVNARVPSMSRVFAVMTFLDPRRFVGLLLAIFGVFISVVVPLLPTSLARRMSYSETTVVVPRRSATVTKQLYAAQSPSPAPYLDSPSIPSKQPSNHTSESIPTSPHVKFVFRPHPRSTSIPSVHNSSSNSIPKFESDSLTYTDQLSHSPDLQLFDRRLMSSPVTFSQSPFNNPDATRSLDSLDLVTSTGAQPIQTANSQTSKRGFRVLKFGKRRSTFDHYREEETTSSPKANTTDSKTPIAKSFEWHGNESFAVKRSKLRTSSIDVPPLLPPARRKFSFFHRESSLGRDILQAVTPAPHDLTSPLFPPPRTLPTAPPLNATAGPSRIQSSPISPPTSPPLRCATLNDILPENTIELPLRPQRTDPYKQFGVPVPGSDRAIAFMKAEKERMRAERERKEKEKTLKDAELAVKADATKRIEIEVVEELGSERNMVTEEGKTPDGEKSRKRAVRCQKLSRKNKESDHPLIPKTSLLDLPDPGAEADMEMTKRKPMLITIPSPDEFGVLPVLLQAVPEENSTTSRSASRSAVASSSLTSLSKRPGTAPSGLSSKRGWVFSRRSSDTGGDRVDKERERERYRERKEKDKEKVKDKETDKAKVKEMKKAQDKEKDKTKDKEKDKAKNKDNEESKKHNVRLRSKSREGIGKLPFVSSRSRKDRGYSSDTGVPSLTYQLIW